MKKDSPFSLTFGKQPAEYISRYENMDTIISAFDSEIPDCNAFLIEGIRGSGKTVLMTMVEKELEKRNDWIVISLNSTRDLLVDLAERLVSLKSKAPSLPKGGFNISVAGFGIGIDGSDNVAGIIDTIERFFDTMVKKKKRVLITIDEVMHDDNMRHFASEFQLLIRKDYPCFLLMTGLYEQIYGIQNDPALTFLLRTPKIKIEPLSLSSIARQYKRIFEISDEKARELAEITKGYAFAFQALGLIYYNKRDKLTPDEILEELDDLLEDFVYRKIWEGLSQQDQRVILAMPGEPIKTGDICAKLSMSSSVFSKYRERLIKRGILYAPRYGYVDLALPRFSKIVRGLCVSQMY